MAVPTDLSGLALWLKSDTGLWQDTAGTVPATAHGDPVGRWDDQSGNNRHATQATAGARPTISTANQYGGIPSLEFTAATGQWFSLPNFLTAFTAGEIFSVMRLRNNQPTVPQRTAIWRFGNESGGNINSHIRWTDGFTYERFGTTVRKEEVSVRQTLGNYFLYNIYSAANDYAMIFNRTAYYESSAAGSNTVGWTTTPMIGRLVSDASYFFDGWWEELFLFSRKLTESERESMTAYIEGRYGVTYTPEPPVRVTTVSGSISGVRTGSASLTNLRGVVVDDLVGLARTTWVGSFVIRTTPPTMVIATHLLGLAARGGTALGVQATHLMGVIIRTKRLRRRGFPWIIGQ